MRYFVESPNVVSSKIAQDFLGAMENSHLIGESPLAGSFRSTEGVAWTVTQSGMGQLQDHLPTLRPLLNAMNLPQGPSALRSRWTQLSKRWCNAFYLNLLLIPPGKKIEAHVDATLRKATQQADLLPKIVSVIWLELPQEIRGGELRLYDQTRPVGAISPSVGKVVHFQGHLNHEVTPVSLPQSCTNEKNLRISLICEQYQLPTKLLKKLSPITTHTRAGFEAYLHHAKSKPLIRFEVD